MMEMGFHKEPECIAFYHGECFYSDIDGRLYCVEL